MKKIIAGLMALIMVLGLLLGGCVSPDNSTPTDNTPSTPSTPVDNTPSNQTTNQATVLDNPPPESVTWISPGKVNVSNFYPGATAEYPMTIHNGHDVATSFSVSYRSPDNVATGYSRPPAEVQSWVIVADMTPILAPKETRDILITLTMPADVAVFSDKWEFWISVTDMSQTGQVHTAMAVRWLIDMR